MPTTVATMQQHPKIMPRPCALSLSNCILQSISRVNVLVQPKVSGLYSGLASLKLSYYAENHAYMLMLSQMCIHLACCKSLANPVAQMQKLTPLLHTRWLNLGACIAQGTPPIVACKHSHIHLTAPGLRPDTQATLLQGINAASAHTAAIT